MNYLAQGSVAEAPTSPASSAPFASPLLRSAPAWLFLIVLVLRLIVLARLTESPFLLPAHGDMHFYNDWALRILHGRWTDHHAFYGLPLYAYLLAALYQIFGYSPFAPAFIQACLEAGTAVVLYQLVRAIFGDSRRGRCIGLLAGLGWGFFEPAAAYSVILMPVAWLVFVFWWLVFQIVKRPTAPSFPRCFLFGAITGFAAMGIATVLFLIPLLIVALLTRWRPAPGCRHRFTRIVTAVAILLSGVAAGMSPCWIHNYFIARDPVLLSAHSGVNFWIGNNPSANGYPRFPPGLHAGQEAMLQDSIKGAEKAAGRPLKRAQVSVYWSSKAREYIREQFGDWLRLLGVKAANFLSAFQYDDLSIITTLRESGILFPGLRFGLVAALALPGLLLAWGRFPLSRWVAGAILLHLIALLTVFITERYRLVAVPGLLLFAAYGLSYLWQAFARLETGAAGLYLGLLGLGTLFVSIPRHDASLWALDSYNSGLQALESGHLQTAKEKLELAYAYVPGNAELNFALGNLQLAQGNKLGARSYYFAALRLDPQHEGSCNNLGVLALQEQRWSVATEFLTKALEQNPADPKTNYLLAKCYLGAGNLPRAAQAIARALELSPTTKEFLALDQEVRRRASQLLTTGG